MFSISSRFSEPLASIFLTLLSLPSFSCTALEFAILTVSTVAPDKSISSAGVVSSSFISLTSTPSRPSIFVSFSIPPKSRVKSLVEAGVPVELIPSAMAFKRLEIPFSEVKGTSLSFNSPEDFSTDEVNAATTIFAAGLSGFVMSETLKSLSPVDSVIFEVIVSITVESIVPSSATTVFSTRFLTCSLVKPESAPLERILSITMFDCSDVNFRFELSDVIFSIIVLTCSSVKLPEVFSRIS